jgi:hypothetical protein
MEEGIALIYAGWLKPDNVLSKKPRIFTYAFEYAFNPLSDALAIED